MAASTNGMSIPPIRSRSAQRIPAWVGQAGGTAASAGNNRTLIQPFVLGGTDGVSSTLAVIAGGIGGGVDTKSIAILGAASLFADAISMGTAETLSASGTAKISYNEIKSGVICFAAFLLSGAVPLTVFLAFSFLNAALSTAAASVSSLALLFGLGYVQAMSLNEERPALLGIRVVCLGGIAGLIAFLVGYALQDVE